MLIILDEIGGTQFGKTPEEYLERTEETADEIRRILGGMWGEARVLLRDIGEALARRGTEFRALNYKGDHAMIARSPGVNSPTLTSTRCPTLTRDVLSIVPAPS